jgi:AcrR family transcriptional regulator
MSLATPIVDPRAGTSGTANRKAQTQQKILRASMELFATRGYHRTSTAQIAALAGVSRASIFWHFSDKATLFGETCRHFLVPFRDSLERGRTHADPRERIRRQVDAYESFIREQSDTIRAFVSWIFASQPHAASLRQELLALHRAFEAGIARDLAEILEDPASGARMASMVVAALHGNLLLSLGRDPAGTEAVRAFLERTVFERSVLRQPPALG